MSKPRLVAALPRIAAITLTLALIGAAVGCALGAVAMWGLTMSMEAPDGRAFFVRVAALFGGVLGFVLAPVAAWTLMRHVPIWRAIVETALGTAIGIVAGVALGATLVPYAVLGPAAFGVAGFAAAAVRLRLTHRGAGTRSSSSETLRSPASSEG
jgi:hypothetical protein